MNIYDWPLSMQTAPCSRTLHSILLPIKGQSLIFQLANIWGERSHTIRDPSSSRASTKQSRNVKSTMLMILAYDLQLQNRQHLIPFKVFQKGSQHFLQLKAMAPSRELSILLCLLCCLLPIFLAQTCGPQDDQFLVTFHPHLDAFWLNTDNELKDINFRPAGFLWAMNQRNSKTIFNSMLDALTQGQNSGNRKYFVTESVFFKDWYDYLSADKKEKVKKILASGQLQIANGGWVENDEAVCYYDDIIDQYTLGHNFLYSQFDYQVKIGWATDSFGHSHSQAAVQHLLGIQFQGIQRVDDRYVNLHKDKPLLEFYWSPISDSNNITYGGVLNHVRHFLHEVNNYRGARHALIKQDYLNIKRAMERYYQKNKLFRFLGNDFEQFTTEEFVLLENVMKDLNKQHKAECPAFKYGNPSDYLDTITKYYNQNTLPTRKWDLMTNWDQDRFWTGYFTTDPLLKKACKDYSRIVNFYRKSLLLLNAYSQNERKLINAQELLAVVQHHDGITATSKTYIQDEFRQRMKTQTNEILQSIGKIHNAGNAIVCKFFQNSNECQISDLQVAGPEIKSLHIITHGGSKKEKIEIGLPSGKFYDIQEVQQDIFCDQDKCTLVFQASLHPGINKFKINSVTKQNFSKYIFDMEPAQQLSYSGRDFTIGIEPSQKHVIKYEYGDGEHFTIGFYTSVNQGSSRQTVAWNKFGNMNDKTQYVVPGMYIMSNNGKLEPFAFSFTQLKVSEGKIFKRVVANSAPSKIKITIKNDEPNIIDVVHTFKPQSRLMADYFMKVSSSVKSDTLFHDSNGFLVSKRPLNWKPDYEFNMKPEDIINGNTYPVCSFAYLIQGDKKFLFFTDRAQGVASFQQDLLINFDRLAMDDGKGVGEGYSKLDRNTFRYKFGLISHQDDTERTWQRAYDQALVGFFVKSADKQLVYLNGQIQQNSHTPGLGPMNNLKYTIFHLNQNEYVLRLQNMGEFSNLLVTKYFGTQGHYEWNIEELGLKLIFFDIKQSYANGVIKQEKLRWRRHWGASEEEVSLITQGRQDSDRFNLRPLELRSFRINKKSAITIKDGSLRNTKNPALGQMTKTGNLRAKIFRKRCF